MVGSLDHRATATDPLARLTTGAAGGLRRPGGAARHGGHEVRARSD